jgi:hypothetical protein
VTPGSGWKKVVRELREDDFDTFDGWFRCQAFDAKLAEVMAT